MAFVGGFLGGGVEMVPAGQMQVLLQWNTEDRQNISGTVFTLTKSDGTSGPYTVNGDASGRAEIIVPAGEYTIEVSHSGSYENDGPQKVIGESTQSYLVLFDAYTNRNARLIFNAFIPGATFVLTKLSDGTQYSGMVQGTVDVSPGNYDIVITSGTITWTKSDFIITGDTVLEGYGVTITWSGPPIQSLTVDGVSATLPCDLLKSDTVHDFEVTLQAQWRSATNVTATFSKVVNESMDITPDYSDAFATSSSISAPYTAEYDILAIGGGGGGGDAGEYNGYRLGGGGGGGGRTNIRTALSISEGTQINVARGAGGSAGGGNGSSTTITVGSVTISASGGDRGLDGATRAGKGGGGGAGGGGGGSEATSRAADGGSGQQPGGYASGEYGGGGGGWGGTFAGVEYTATAGSGLSGGQYGGGRGGGPGSAAQGGNPLNVLFGTSLGRGGNGASISAATAGNYGGMLIAMRLVSS